MNACTFSTVHASNSVDSIASGSVRWLCGGDAVCRSTEFRHWLAAKREAQDLLASAAAPIVQHQTEPSTSILGSPSHDGDEDLDQSSTAADVTQQANSSSLQPPAVSSTQESQEESDGHTGCGDRNKDNGAEGDIIWSNIEAMQLVEEMDASQHNFMQILSFGKQLYERGCQVHGTPAGSGCEQESSESMWPQSWQSALKILQEAGYVPPRTYYICLNNSHHCNWDVLSTPSESCRHCGEPGSIKYYYLLQQEWLLPVKCTECSAIIGVSQIKEQLCSGTQQQVPRNYIVATVQAELTIIAGAVQVEVSCGECRHSFQHTPQYARGDPRNIALIGHWDGFKPFRSTGQHSCGMYT